MDVQRQEGGPALYPPQQPNGPQQAPDPVCPIGPGDAYNIVASDDQAHKGGSKTAHGQGASQVPLHPPPALADPQPATGADRPDGLGYAPGASHNAPSSGGPPIEGLGSETQAIGFAPDEAWELADLEDFFGPESFRL